MYKRDGHIHTPYCPHGTKDGLKEYIQRAIDLGFTEITFTEHAPLPKGFEDAAPTKDSSMTMEQLPSYVDKVLEVKEQFRGELKINLGLEIDYIEGFEDGTREFLHEWGKFLDDSLLSVHFLKNPLGNYDCLDYSPEIFAEMIQTYGHVDRIYECYFKTLSKSISADLGAFKPKRIGHMTLVQKFQKQFPAGQDFSFTINEILGQVKQYDLELDYNAAGLFKPLCEETYPPQWAIKEAMNLQIPLVYGSDAHQAKDLGQGRHLLLTRNS